MGALSPPAVGLEFDEAALERSAADRAGDARIAEREATRHQRSQRRRAAGWFRRRWRVRSRRCRPAPGRSSRCSARTPVIPISKTRSRALCPPTLSARRLGGELHVGAIALLEGFAGETGSPPTAQPGAHLVDRRARRPRPPSLRLVRSIASASCCSSGLAWPRSTMRSVFQSSAKVISGPRRCGEDGATRTDSAPETTSSGSAGDERSSPFSPPTFALQAGLGCRRPWQTTRRRRRWASGPLGACPASPAAAIGASNSSPWH